MLSINADTLGKLLTILVASVFLALGVFYFNNAVASAYLFYFILLFSAFLCRKQPDIRGVIAIIFIIRLIEEVIWSGLIFYESEILLIPIYLVLGIGVWKLADEKQTKKPLRALLIVMISFELYWFYQNYESPVIYPYLFTIVQCLILQWLIFARAMYGFKYKFLGKETKLDFKVYKLARWTIFLEIAMISEYLIRHTLNINILVVYHTYPYLYHLISMYTLYLLFDASYKQLLPQKLKA